MCVCVCVLRVLALALGAPRSRVAIAAPPHATERALHAVSPWHSAVAFRQLLRINHARAVPSPHREEAARPDENERADCILFLLCERKGRGVVCVEGTQTDYVLLLVRSISRGARESLSEGSGTRTPRRNTTKVEAPTAFFTNAPFNCRAAPQNSSLLQTRSLHLSATQAIAFARF